MKMQKILLIICLILLLANHTALAVQPVASSFTLANGIRVVSVYISGSSNVSIFSFFPMGLVYDGPGKAQWSHLLEHMIVRSPKPLSYTEANAETLPDNIRLDFYGSVDNWQQGLSHHVCWIKGTPFTEQRLQEEKINVNSECDVVAKRFATHKFAMAAWAQGYRHGRKHASLKGDINKVTLNEIQEYRDAHLVVLDKVVICIVGGIDVKALKPIIMENFATVKNNAKMQEPVELHPGNLKITWDIEARHLMLTWPIPRFNEQDYPALMVASKWLMMKFFADSELKKSAPMVFSGADLITPEKNFFYISASLKPGVSSAAVGKKLQQHLQALSLDSANPLEAGMIGQQLSYQLSHLTDPALLREQTPKSMTDAMIEANIGLQWGMHEFHYGSYRKALAKKLTTVTATQVQRVVQKYLTSDKCSSCTINPE